MIFLAPGGKSGYSISRINVRRHTMSDFTVFPKSVRPHGCGKAYMLRDHQGKEWFVNCGITHPLDHKTAEMLRREFPWTAPSRVLALRKTVAVGDRLDLCAAGILEACRESDAVPVPVQQSARELSLSGRTLEEALDAATFAVYREGYLGPWGACADRLQSFQEIEAALAAGCTCLSVDCAPLLGQGEPPSDELREQYQGRTFSVEGKQIRFERLTLEDCCREYGQVIILLSEIYYSYVQRSGVDLEVLLNEADTPTGVAGLYFLANELCRRGIAFQAVCPRLELPLEAAAPLDGEAESLREEAELLACVSRSFGFKLSFRNLEQKPELLTLLGEAAGYRLHASLGGLSWLEAMRLLAREEPVLFRLVYGIALTALPVARQVFPSSLDESALPSLDGLEDNALPGLLSGTPVEQLLELTYGQVLHSQLKDRLAAFLRSHAAELEELVRNRVRADLDRLK